MVNVSFYSVGKRIRETHRIPTISASHDLVRELTKSRATRKMPLTLESSELPTCDILQVSAVVSHLQNPFVDD